MEALRNENEKKKRGTGEMELIKVTSSVGDKKSCDPDCLPQEPLCVPQADPCVPTH